MLSTVAGFLLVFNGPNLPKSKFTLEEQPCCTVAPLTEQGLMHTTPGHTLHCNAWSVHALLRAHQKRPQVVLHGFNDPPEIGESVSIHHLWLLPNGSGISINLKHWNKKPGHLFNITPQGKCQNNQDRAQTSSRCRKADTCCSAMALYCSSVVASELRKACMHCLKNGSWGHWMTQNNLNLWVPWL